MSDHTSVSDSRWGSDQGDAGPSDAGLDAGPSDAGPSDAGPSGTVPFKVAVNGLRTSKGLVRMSICDNPTCYKDQQGFLFEENKPADTAGVSFLFSVSPGDHVVLMFHDENGNDAFDTNFFGWPKEGFGFSNNIKPGLSAPPYEKVVVNVGPAGQAITVVVQYM